MSATVEYNLADVLVNNAERSTELIGPINAYVMNFRADHAFPRKFYYDGCTVPRGNTGLFCAKSVDGHGRCTHDSRSKGKVRAMWRFHLLLMDQSGCVPVFAQIFDSAATELLGISAERFKDLPHLEQMHLVHAATITCRTFSLWIASREDPRTEKWMPTIQEIRPFVPGPPIVACTPSRGVRTPKKEKGPISLSSPECYTHENCFGSCPHSQGASSTKSKKKGTRDEYSSAGSRAELIKRFERWEQFEQWCDSKKKPTFFDLTK